MASNIDKLGYKDKVNRALYIENLVPRQCSCFSPESKKCRNSRYILSLFSHRVYCQSHHIYICCKYLKKYVTFFNFHILLLINILLVLLYVSAINTIQRPTGLWLLYRVKLLMSPLRILVVYLLVLWCTKYTENYFFIVNVLG